MLGLCKKGQNVLVKYDKNIIRILLWVMRLTFVKRVQQELERTGYIPNMAGILLARNNSRIIGVVVNDHVKYEGRVLEDGFVMASLANGL